MKNISWSRELQVQRPWDGSPSGRFKEQKGRQWVRREVVSYEAGGIKGMMAQDAEDAGFHFEWNGKHGRVQIRWLCGHSSSGLWSGGCSLLILQRVGEAEGGAWWKHWRRGAVTESLSLVLFFATPWTAARQASLSFTVSGSLLKFMSIESVMPSNHLILCCSLLLLPSIFPSIRFFSHELALCIRWLRYWSFSFSISPSNEYSGLIFFRIDWCDLIAVQGTLKSLLQHHSLKASILRHSAFFIV